MSNGTRRKRKKKGLLAAKPYRASTRIPSEYDGFRRPKLTLAWNSARLSRRTAKARAGDAAVTYSVGEGGDYR